MERQEKRHLDPRNFFWYLSVCLTIAAMVATGCSTGPESIIVSTPQETKPSRPSQHSLQRVHPTIEASNSKSVLKEEETAIPTKYSTPRRTVLTAPTPPNQNPTSVPARVLPSPVVTVHRPKLGNEIIRGGLLNLSSRSNIAHMDVHDEASPVLSTWGPGIVYSRLMRYRSGAGVKLPSLEVECDLCKSWHMQSNDVFVFKLRENSTWQNVDPVNGRKVNADDIVFSYGRQIQSDRPNAPLLGGVASIQALDPTNIKISLSSPDSDFLLSVAHGHSKIVAPESVAINGDLRDGPTIGTGPWILVDTSQDVMHSFKSNPSYFEPGFPLIHELDIHIISNPDTRNAAFRVGSLDVEQMDEVQWASYHEDHPSAEFLAIPDTTMGIEISLNSTTEPFSDVRVRRAVFQSIDPWGAIDTIWHGRAYLSPSFPIASPDWFLSENDLRKYFDNPDSARKLLAEIGVGQLSSIEIIVGDFGDMYHAHALRILNEMRSVGFIADINLVNKRIYANDAWSEGNYQMLIGPPAQSATPNGYILPVLHSGGRLNSGGIDDAELDTLIEKQSQELDRNARTQLVKSIQLKLLKDAYRFMPAAKLSIWTWGSRVRDFHPNFAGFEYAHWNRVWVND